MLRLSLKGVERIHGIFELNSVDGAERIASVIGNDLENSAREVFQGLGVDVPGTDLCLIKRVSDMALHDLRKSGQYTLRVGDPNQLLQRHLSPITNMPDLA